MPRINLKDPSDHNSLSVWCECLAVMCRDMLREGKTEADMRAELDRMNRNSGTGLLFSATINEVKGRRFVVLSWCQEDERDV